MAKLPPDAAPSKRTAVFSETTVPKGLLSEHTTKAGAWGVIHVLRGELRYVVPAEGIDVVLTPEVNGIIEPEKRHRVQPLGAVRFFVEFWRRDG